MVTKLPYFYLTSEYYSLSVLSGKFLFSWNRSCISKVVVIWIYDAENVEFKFSRLRRHLKTRLFQSLISIEFTWESSLSQQLPQILSNYIAISVKDDCSHSLVPRLFFRWSFAHVLLLLHQYLKCKWHENFYCFIWKTLKNQEHCRLPFLDIFSRSRVIKV